MLVDIANTGGVAGAEVAQLYLTYPPAANEPPRQLRGFEKLWLLPGQKGTARFEMTARSVSIWDVAAHVSSLGISSDPVPGRRLLAPQRAVANRFGRCNEGSLQ